MKQFIKKKLIKALTESNNAMVNAEGEINNLKALPLDAEDGVTLNLDGTTFTGTGLVVPVTSVNIKQGELSIDSLANFMRQNANNITNNGNFKFGLYKFPHSDQVSIDLNIVVADDEASRKIALEFGRLAGQESLFHLGTFTNIKTGATGDNPKKFTPDEFKEIATSLNNRVLPQAIQTTLDNAAQRFAQTGLKGKIREHLLMENRIKFELHVPSDILAIKDVFKHNGNKLYIVGGAVRDAVLGKKPKDFDLATDAVPDVVEEIMNRAGFKTLPTGKAFGVINVFTNMGEYEIATFRTDIGSSDARRPDSVKFTDINHDVMRRDLTINALFYDIDQHEIVDLVGGVNDLKNGVVRTVGRPEERFNEDRLRILRAIRFAGRFGSELNPDVDAALKNNASLEGISGERIRDEFIKGIVSAKSVKHFLGLINKYGLIFQIFKGLQINKQFIEDKDPLLVITTILKYNDVATLGKQLNNLKYTDDEIKGVKFLINLVSLSPATAVQLKRMQKIAGVSDDQIRKFGTQEGLNPKLLNAFIGFNLTVSGDELMKTIGLKPGKEVGDAIAKAEFDNFQKLL
jgi:tRNA nucleotidyltransferase/poly(A) polymerase